MKHTQITKRSIRWSHTTVALNPHLLLLCLSIIFSFSHARLSFSYSLWKELDGKFASYKCVYIQHFRLFFEHAKIYPHFSQRYCFSSHSPVGWFRCKIIHTAHAFFLLFTQSVRNSWSRRKFLFNKISLAPSMRY